MTGETAWSKKCHSFDTTKTPPEHRQNTTETTPKHEQNTQEMTEHRQDTTDTPQKCHQDTTTTETLFRDHQDTSTDTIRTNATNSRKACKGRLPKSCCQLPNEYMQVYGGRYIGATGDRLLKRHLQVDICRCRVADVKTQVGINFLKSTYNIFSKFLVGRQGSVD